MINHKKAIIALIFLIFFISAFFIVDINNQYERLMDLSINEKEKNLDFSLKETNRLLFDKKMSDFKKELTFNPDISKAFFKKDKKKLYQLSLPAFSSLKSANPSILFFEYILPDGNLFLCLENDEKKTGHECRGKIKPFNLFKLKQSSNIFYYHGRPIYLMIFPLEFNDKFIGRVAMGFKFKDFLNLFNNRFKDKFAVYFAKELIKKETLDIGTRPMEAGNFYVFSKDKELFKSIENGLNFSFSQQKMSNDGMTFVVHNHIFFSQENEVPAGGVLYFQDMTLLTESRLKFITTSILLSVVTMIIACTVTLFFFNFFQQRMSNLEVSLQDKEDEMEKSVQRYSKRMEEHTFDMASINAALNREIAERIQAEGEAKKLSRQMELILNAAGEGIFGLDTEGKVTFVNNAAAIMLDWPKKELLGKQHHDLVHHSRPDGTPFPYEECPIQTAYREGIVKQSSNEVFWTKNGESFPVEYVSTPIIEDGQIKGAVVMFRDLSIFP